MNFPRQFAYFFTTKEFHPSVTHFASPFWWRSFRRFCPLVICTETASRFERGPKHVAQRWGIEADGFVGKCMTKTFKASPRDVQNQLVPVRFFQQNFLSFCCLFFVDAKRKYQPGMPSAKDKNTKKRCSEVVSFYGTRFHSSGFLQIRRVDLVEWYERARFLTSMDRSHINPMAHRIYWSHISGADLTSSQWHTAGKQVRFSELCNTNVYNSLAICYSFF